MYYNLYIKIYLENQVPSKCIFDYRYTTYDDVFDKKYFYVYVMWSKNYFACRGISLHSDFKKTFPQNVNYMTLLLLCVLTRQVLYLIRGLIIGSLFLLDLELDNN